MTIKLADLLKGKSYNMSIDDIAEKHKVSVEKIKSELEMGMKVEMEHTSSKRIAKQISMDHLVELPDYYTRLAKMESEK